MQNFSNEKGGLKGGDFPRQGNRGFYKIFTLRINFLSMISFPLLRQKAEIYFDQFFKYVM